MNKVALEAVLGYQFATPSLLKQALTHRSFSMDNNERLEFLGDALLGCITAEALYSETESFKEGDLSQLRAALVKGKTLAAIARELNLGQHMIMGEGERKTGGHDKASMLADALEAIIGAIYLDSDFAQTKVVVTRLLNTRWRSLLGSGDSQKDAKTQLQEHLQAHKKTLPVYQLTSVEGADHQQLFTISCCVDGVNQAFMAQASNRRQAEKQAAKQALAYLRDNIHE
ncbi:ribonuclease III [bacterium]|nr:ribonuclease III [bacterium]